MNESTTMKWVRLGDYVEQCDERVGEKNFSIDDVVGISNEKMLIPTKANMTDVSLSPYKLLKPKDFSYVTVTSRNGEKLSLAINLTHNTYIVSSSYVVFRCKNSDVLDPEYLFMLMNREEFDRYTRFNSWGSARETFDWSEMCRIEIPLPDIEVQRELVAVYNGLKALAEENEALVPRLSAACHAYIVDCREKYPSVQLGDYIEVKDQKNTEGLELPFYGINREKEFMPTVANTNELNHKKYKIVENDMFAFSGMQTGRDVCIRIAHSNRKNPILISPAYTTFVVKNQAELLSSYLSLQFKRSESDRFGWFVSDGSIRSNLDWTRFCEIEFPLPPIEVQKEIVEVFNCAERAKKIAADARQRLKTICSALVQKAANS